MAASLIHIIDSLNSSNLIQVLKELSLSVQPGGPKGTLDPARIQPSLKEIVGVVESIESSQYDKEIKEVANASHGPKIDLLRKIFSFFSLSENFKLFFSKLSAENSNIFYREHQERADRTKICFNNFASHVKNKTDGLRDEIEKENSISEIFMVKPGPVNAIEEARSQEYPYSHMIPPNLLEELLELQEKAESIVNSDFPLANRIEELAKLYQYYESGLKKQVEMFLLPGQELFNFF